MKIGILVSTNDPETLWNAFRFANLCMNTDVTNEVTMFLNAKAVDYEKHDSGNFNLKELAKIYPQRRETSRMRQMPRVQGAGRK
jgi:hypothetical protein